MDPLQGCRHLCCGRLAFVLPNALRAANDVRFTMVVSVVSMAGMAAGDSP